MAKIVGEIFSTLRSIKELYDKVEGNKNKCKDLINLCISFEESLNALERSSVEIKASSLSELLDLLKYCFKYCQKYVGKRWILKALVAFQGKEEFDELNSKLLSVSNSLQLNLSAKIIVTQSEKIEHDRKDKEETHRLLKELIISNKIQAQRVDELKEKLRVAAKQELEIIEAVDDLDSSTSLPPTTAKGNSFLESLDLSDLFWSEDLNDFLGEGGFGVVYKGTYKGKDCAVKCLRLAGSPTPEELIKIQKEARVAALLKHENVIEFFGCSMSRKVLVFELASCSLSDVIYGKKIFSLQKSDGTCTTEALESFDTMLLLIKDILNGMTYLHSLGVLHRDIKPANILLVQAASHQSEKGFIGKISDFGLATSNTFTSTASLTKGSSRALGSDAYLAPELLNFNGRPPYSFASDMYAVGITINEALTRASPYSGLKTIQIGMQVAFNQERPDLFKPDQSKVEERELSGLLGSSESGLLHQNPGHRLTALLSLETIQFCLSQQEKPFNPLINVEEKVISELVNQSSSFAEASSFPEIEMIRNGSSQQKIDAAEAIKILARNQVNQKKLYNAGVVPPLIAVLKEGTPEGKSNAAGAIMNIALHRDNKVRMYNAGVVPPLIALLKEGTAEGKKYAAGALRNIAFHSDNKVRMYDAGVVPPLIALLIEGTAEGKSNTAGAIRNIAFHSDNKVRMYDAGVVPPLIAVLKEGTPEGKSNAAGVIQNIASHSDNIVRMYDAGVVLPLIALLKEGTSEGKENAAGAIMNIAAHSDNQVRIYDAGVVPPLIALLKEGTPEGKSNAAGAIMNIALHRDNKVRMYNAGVVPPLIALLKEGTPVGKENSAGAIWNIAVHSENKVRMYDAGVVPPLIALLKEGTPDGKENAAGALRNIAVKVNCKLLGVSKREIGLQENRCFFNFFI